MEREVGAEMRGIFFFEKKKKHAACLGDGRTNKSNIHTTSLQVVEAWLRPSPFLRCDPGNTHDGLGILVTLSF